MSGFDALREKGGSTALAESDDEMNLPECSIDDIMDKKEVAENCRDPSCIAEYPYQTTDSVRRTSLFEESHVPLETINEEGDCHTEENTVSPVPELPEKRDGTSSPMRSFYDLTKNKEVSEEAHILGRQNLSHYSTASGDSRARRVSIPARGESSSITKPLSPVKRKPLSLQATKKPSNVVFIKSPSADQSIKPLNHPPQTKGLNVYQRLSLPVTKGTYALRKSVEPAPRLSYSGTQRSSRPAPLDEKQLMVQQMEELRRKNVRLTAELEKCKSDLKKAELRIRQLEREKRQSY
ncbi:hypothetical protein WA577_006092, partial [Blastocystis sp. JDR]